MKLGHYIHIANNKSLHTHFTQQSKWSSFGMEHVDRLISHILDSPRLRVGRNIVARKFGKSVMEMAQSFADAAAAGDLSHLLSPDSAAAILTYDKFQQCGTVSLIRFIFNGRGDGLWRPRRLPWLNGQLESLKCHYCETKPLLTSKQRRRSDFIGECTPLKRKIKCLTNRNNTIPSYWRLCLDGRPLRYLRKERKFHKRFKWAKERRL